MATKVCIGLSNEERAELERLYRRTRDGALKMRSLMIRLLDKGEKPREIADRLGVSSVTIWRWSHRYLLEGIAGLHTRPRKGRPPKLRPEVRELLVQAAESSPRNVGLNSSNWTLGLLAHYLERETGIKMSLEAVRQCLRRAGFTLKRPSAVVISPDPEYEEKKGTCTACWPAI